MNIMEKLGFSRKGERDIETEKQNNNLNEMKENRLNLVDKTERKEGESRVYNLVILDESGSMGQIYMQALTGANETISTIRKEQDEDPSLKQILTFVTFDSNSRRQDVRTIINCEAIENVKDITEQDYNPGGCTPLYDAMGLSITSLRTIVKDGDNVLVTVITDGYENSSKEFSGQMVKELVEELRGKGWVFTYIGANQDSVEVSRGLGINNSMDFRQDAVGTGMMFEKMNSSRRAYYKKVRMMKDRGFECDLEDDFFADKQIGARITPEHIENLEPGQIFVFGSNLDGAHYGGAARLANQRFGAVMGQGVGLQGQSYAIPTMQGGVETIKPYVDEFLAFADRHPEMTFLVTRIGCGIAGFTPMEIAPLFAGALGLQNVCLPQDFWNVINYKFRR